MTVAPIAKNAATPSFTSCVSSCAPYSDRYSPLSQPSSRISRLQTNINFLDRPLFIPARKLLDPSTGKLKPVEQVTRYTDGNGFEIQALVDTEKELKGEKAHHGLPTFFDKKVLTLLAAHLPLFDETLAEAKRRMDADTSNQINSVEITNIRGFLREIHVTEDSRSAKRLKESLAKWTEILLIFRNNSLTTRKDETGETLTTLIDNKAIKVLDRVEYTEDTRGRVQSIKVQFNRDFLLCNNDDFSRRVSLDVLFSFTSPTAARLYEILCKSFWGRAGRKVCSRTGRILWSINLETLLAKLGTHRVRNAAKLFKDAIQEVNERDTQNFTLYKLRPGAEGQIVVEFQRYALAKDSKKN